MFTVNQRYKSLIFTDAMSMVAKFSHDFEGCTFVPMRPYLMPMVYTYLSKAWRFEGNVSGSVVRYFRIFDKVFVFRSFFFTRGLPACPSCGSLDYEMKDGRVECLCGQKGPNVNRPLLAWMNSFKDDDRCPFCGGNEVVEVGWDWPARVVCDTCRADRPHLRKEREGYVLYPIRSSVA